MTRYDAAMQHSIVARHAAWPARYVHQSHRARERRLGLYAGPSFVAAPCHRTVLHRPEAGPLAALRASWRVMEVTPSRRTVVGQSSPATGMAWTSSDRGAGPRRSSLAPAWRA
jgi:hypothetical protein